MLNHFYPVESQGHLVKTFHDLVAKHFKKLHVPPHPWHGIHQNLTKTEEQVLKKLQSYHSVTVRAADKGGGIVVQDYEENNEEALWILSDNNKYYESQLKSISTTQKELKFYLHRPWIIRYSLKKALFISIKFLIFHIFICQKFIKMQGNLQVAWFFILGFNSLTSNLSHFIDFKLTKVRENHPKFSKGLRFP